MTTITQVAQAFVDGRSAKCHNARTDGTQYVLYHTTIARKHPNGAVEFDWGGWYTTTTANHMNHILRAMNARRQVSYAQARDNDESWFVVDAWEPEEVLA